MAKRRKKVKKHKIVLEIGKFYNVHEGSAKGHPGRIEKADYSKNEFLSVTTHSLSEHEYNEKKVNKTFRKDFLELKSATTEDVFKSFIHRRPFLGTRDDYGEKEYPNMSFSEKDTNKIEKVKTRKPRIGYWLKRKKKAFN